jgi:hypothetical protein
MHWKSSPLATRSKELKGTELGAGIEQMSRFAARQAYRVHDDVLSNPGSREKFQAHRPALDGEQKSLMDGLETQGYSKVAVTDLFTGDAGFSWDGCLAESAKFVERVEADIAKRQAKEEAKAKKGKKREKGLGKGDYIMRLFGKEVPTLGPDDPWLQIGTDDRVLDVVNSYFGLWSKLTYVDLWYTPPAPPGVDRVSSQRWHRDYNDERLVKVFIYLTDINDDTGPLEYVPGSTVGGPYGDAWPWRPVSNDLYPPQDEFEQRVPKDAQIAFTAPEGTMLFCNTSGFHRGGYATGQRPRVMAVYNYSTPASLEALTLRNFKPDVPGDGLSEQAAYALA